MPKNIVVFSDGTGQEGGKDFSTNVYKLFNMVEDRTPNQIAFYDRGLGTGWRKLSGNVFGYGISENIRECYEFIFENHEAGDQVYLFGFSRGAFTVRSLSGMIELFGILPKSRKGLIKEAYKIYKIKDRQKRLAKKDEFLSRHHSMKCPIKVIGVWDTVDALGIPVKALDIINPFKHTFHDTNMSQNVEYGYHALSIDDQRKVFHPTLWDERNVASGQTVEQVWFAGMHTDVGGGYEQHGLSDITLDWMVKKVTPQGLRIYLNHNVRATPNADGHMHDSRDGIGRFYRTAQRKLDPRIVTTRVHQSVLDRKLDKFNDPNSKYDPWILQHSHTVEPWPKVDDGVAPPND